jgi:hypothetical protein
VVVVVEDAEDEEQPAAKVVAASATSRANLWDLMHSLPLPAASPGLPGTRIGRWGKGSAGGPD